MAIQDHVVLWVDDDEDDQLIVRKALRSCRPDLSVMGLSDGEELLRYLRQEGADSSGDPNPRPGIVFLGFHMPRRSGLEVLAEIREDPRFKQIPVVMISTLGGEEEIEMAFRLGANGCLDLPPSFQRLCESMRGALDAWFDKDGNSEIPYRGGLVNQA